MCHNLLLLFVDLLSLQKVEGWVSVNDIYSIHENYHIVPITSNSMQALSTLPIATLTCKN